MATRYQARHRSSTPGRGAVQGRARKRRPAYFHVLRRPLASAAAVVAVAGAGVGGYASGTKPEMSTTPFITKLPATAQAAQPPDKQIDANAALAGRALDLARRASAARTARQQVRQGVLDRGRSNPRAVGRLLVAEEGWGEKQWGCLDRLWTRESNWRWNADNPTSDAYGIPQSLPGSKMASVGSDWVTNPVTQVRWGLTYISNRYGTPCSAWSFWQSANWY